MLSAASPVMGQNPTAWSPKFERPVDGDRRSPPPTVAAFITLLKGDGSASGASAQAARPAGQASPAPAASVQGQAHAGSLGAEARLTRSPASAVGAGPAGSDGSTRWRRGMLGEAPSQWSPPVSGRPLWDWDRKRLAATNLPQVADAAARPTAAVRAPAAPVHPQQQASAAPPQQGGVAKRPPSRQLLAGAAPPKVPRQARTPSPSETTGGRIGRYILEVGLAEQLVSDRNSGHAQHALRRLATRASESQDSADLSMAPKALRHCEQLDSCAILRRMPSMSIVESNHNIQAPVVVYYVL